MFHGLCNFLAARTFRRCRFRATERQSAAQASAYSGDMTDPSSRVRTLSGTESLDCFTGLGWSFMGALT